MISKTIFIKSHTFPKEALLTLRKNTYRKHLTCQAMHYENMHNRRAFISSAFTFFSLANFTLTLSWLIRSFAAVDDLTLAFSYLWTSCSPCKILNVVLIMPAYWIIYNNTHWLKVNKSLFPENKRYWTSKNWHVEKLLTFKCHTQKKYEQ